MSRARSLACGCLLAVAAVPAAELVRIEPSHHHLFPGGIP
jgi:hypothetical protein